MKSFRLFTAMVCFVAASAGATTLLPLSDRGLVDHADAIVIGTVADTFSHRLTGGGIVTDTRLRIEEVMKGSVSVNEIVTIREAGGLVGIAFTLIPSSARYSAGEHVFVFLRRADGSRWFTAGMSLGKFAFDSDSRGDTVLLRSTEGEADERPRLANSFRSFVRDVAAGRTPSTLSYISSGFVAKPEFKATTEFSASSYTQTIGGMGLRWNGQPGITVPYVVTGTLGGGLSNTTAAAASAWKTAPGSNFVWSLSTGSPNADATVVDHLNTVYLGYTGTVPSNIGCDAKGCTIYNGNTSNTHTFPTPGGETFVTLSEIDIVFPSNQTFTQAQFDATATHEFGHGIGLRHADQGTPFSSSAIMTSITNAAFGTTLQQWDKDAVSTVYGSGPPCVPAGIASQSQSGNVTSGSQATLSVTANGDSPFTYQWYNGQQDNTTSPIGGATNSSFQTPPITTAKSFWVKVTNACGSASSNTITLTPTQCVAPSINVQPQGSAINSGSTATMSVNAAGSLPLTYQWFNGQSGNESSVPPNANSQSFTTPPLTQQSLFWVKVSNSCGSANSSTATVTINGVCQTPQITDNPGSISLNIGQTPDVTLTVTGATSMQWYQGQPGDTSHPLAGATTPTLPATVTLSIGSNPFWLQAINACGPANSGLNIVLNCFLGQPIISVPATTLSGLGYTITWSGALGFLSHFELQESTSSTFDGGSTQTFTVTSATSRAMSPHVVTADTRYYYRVRAIPSCGGDASEFSTPASVLIVAKPGANSSSFTTGLPFGTTDPFNFNYNVNAAFNKTGKKGIAATESFSINADVPWVTISPKNGTINADGSATPVTITVDPGELPFGSSQGTLTVTHSDTSSSNPTIQSTTSTQVPLSVSLVSPVTPTPKDPNAPSHTLVVPAVGHGEGIGSLFVSDVRVTNTAAQAIQYLLTFTAQNTDGTQSGKQMKVNIAGGGTLALNDIVKSWFGSGAAGEAGLGSIEIRPLNEPSTATSHTTVGASRTYASTPTGTFGQFIPALPTSNFLAKSDSALISLQQVAQSASFRTNFGLIEGSGQPASVELRLLDGHNNQIATSTFNLKPYELQQFNFGAAFPNVTLNDGRVEARVLSDTGKISAYASVLDNTTNDPLLVLPVDPTKVSDTTFVLPGIGDFDVNVAHWKSDVRVYNASSSSVPVTLTYYPQGNGPTHSITTTLAGGEVRAFDNFIASQFGLSVTAGSLVVTSPSSSSLIATARTYTDTGHGTYGQFIPGVVPTDGVGAGERPLQVLQLEESPSFHTNAGVVELTGNPVHVRITGVPPDGRTSAIVDLDVGPYQFVQLNRIFAGMGYGTVYNGRISVEVTDGAGRITAYASNIDNQTQDPTYIPSQ